MTAFVNRAVNGIGAVIVRRPWLVVAVTVIVCAAFSARAVAALVEASYLAPAPLAHPPLITDARTPPKPRTPPDGGSLVTRNMFCSSCGPVAGPGPVSTFVPAAILIATSIGDDPRATVRVPASEVQGSWGVGDDIPGLGKLDAIHFASIDIIDANGRRGRLVLAGAATPARVETAAPVDPWAERIKKIDDHTFEVDRSLVRDLVGGGVKPGTIRVFPITTNGEMAGLRLGGAPAGSLPAALGLRAGDTLSAVNGTEIKSANVLIGLYAQLDQLHTVELDGKRGDKPLQVTLRLR